MIDEQHRVAARLVVDAATPTAMPSGLQQNGSIQ
jgi:hypothetical protein